MMADLGFRGNIRGKGAGIRGFKSPLGHCRSELRFSFLIEPHSSRLWASIAHLLHIYSLAIFLASASRAEARSSGRA